MGHPAHDEPKLRSELLSIMQPRLWIHVPCIGSRALPAFEDLRLDGVGQCVLQTRCKCLRGFLSLPRDVMIADIYFALKTLVFTKSFEIVGLGGTSGFCDLQLGGILAGLQVVKTCACFYPLTSASNSRHWNSCVFVVV